MPSTTQRIGINYKGDWPGPLAIDYWNLIMLRVEVRISCARVKFEFELGSDRSVLALSLNTFEHLITHEREFSTKQVSKTSR